MKCERYQVRTTVWLGNEEFYNIHRNINNIQFILHLLVSGDSH